MNKQDIIIIGMVLSLLVLLICMAIPIQKFLHSSGDTFKERLRCSKYVERDVSSGYSFGSGKVSHTVTYELGGGVIDACKYKFGLQKDYSVPVSYPPGTTVALGYAYGIKNSAETLNETYCLILLKCAGIEIDINLTEEGQKTK